jgi:hypothetical protein
MISHWSDGIWPVGCVVLFINGIEKVFSMPKKTHLCVYCLQGCGSRRLLKEHFRIKKKCRALRDAQAVLDEDEFISSYFDLPKSPIKKVKPKDLGLLGVEYQHRTEEESAAEGEAYLSGCLVIDHDDDDDHGGGCDDDDDDGGGHDEDHDVEFYKMGRDIPVEEYKFADPSDDEQEGEVYDEDDDEAEEDGQAEDHGHNDNNSVVEKEKEMGSEGTVATEGSIQGIAEGNTTNTTAPLRQPLAHWMQLFGDQVDMTLMEKREKEFLKGYQGSKFTVDQEVRIELAYKLDKAKAPLNAFDSLLEWGQHIAPDRADGISGSRKTLVGELQPREVW